MYVSALLFVGCNTVDPEMKVEEGGVYVTVSTMDPQHLTRALERDGITELNENRITTLDFFFYTENADSTSKAVAYGHLDAEAQMVKRFKVDLESGDFAAVFGGTSAYATAKLYVIANCPAAIRNGFHKDESFKELCSIVVEESGFKNTSKHIQDCFIMSGSSFVTKKTDGTNTYAEGEIQVRRTAAKFTVNAKLQKTPFGESVTDGGMTTWWMPVYDEDFKAEFHYGNVFGTLDENYSVPKGETYKDSLFNSDERKMRLVSGTGESAVYSPDPFYTCARSWDYGDVDEPYLLLTVNMVESDGDGNITGTEKKPCYFRVLLSSKNFRMNHWYDINLTITLLGSWTKTDPTVINADYYYVKDWLSQVTDTSVPGTAAQVEGVRFLQMNDHHYNAYNLNTMSIPLTSSHECEIVSATYSHVVYNSTSKTFDTKTGDASSWFDLDNIGGVQTVVLNHTLNNSWGTDMDTTPYEFTVIVCHKDDASYTETFTLTQYPPITLSHETNESMGTGYGMGDRGDVYVNGQIRWLIGSFPTTGEQTYWERYGTQADYPRYNTVRTRTLNGTAGAEGVQNMYIIETKILPAGSSYIITDVRNNTPNQIEDPSGSLGSGLQDLFDASNGVDVAMNPGLAEGLALYGGSPRKMLYYYATSTSEDSKNYISPKFRVASNFSSAGDMAGKSTYVDYISFARRCATYQEAGFPAGRWRLPTEAEIRYICQLQKSNLIPTIFGDNPYVCATNVVDVDASSNLTIEPFTTMPSIRCVYDDWYWENTDNRVQNTSAVRFGETRNIKTTGGRLPKESWDTFVWGDMPR